MALIIGLATIGTALRPSFTAAKKAHTNAAIQALLPQATGKQLQLLTKQAQKLDFGEILASYQLGKYRILYSQTAQAYTAAIEMLIGINNDTGCIIAVSAVKHAETPGIGARILTAKWLAQLQQCPNTGSQAELSVDGATIDGLTGATITAQAVIQHVQALLR